MIKFFRKIRQKLVSENNFRKYLVYAIGEIVLVVIGILIAINLNNSNERSTIKKNVDAQFKLLEYSIYQDSLSFQRLINYNSNQLENSKRLIRLLNNFKTEENCVEFINKFNNIIEIRTNIVDRSIYDEMVNTGAFSKIEKQELKSQIATYYQLTEHFSSVIGIHVNDFREFKNKIASDGTIARIYFDLDASIDENARCEYIKSLIQDDEKKKLIENYIYSSIDTYEQITELYSVLLNNVMKGLFKIEK